MVRCERCSTVFKAVYHTGRCSKPAQIQWLECSVFDDPWREMLEGEREKVLEFYNRFFTEEELRDRIKNPSFQNLTKGDGEGTL